MLLYQSHSHHEMQWFYAARLEHGHLWGAIKIDFCLTNGFISNYEYSNGDGDVTNSIGLANDIMMFNRSPCMQVRLIELSDNKQSLQIHDPQNSFHLEYELM